MENLEGLEVFDVVSDPIIGFDYLEYKLKTYPNRINSQKALFLISYSGKAFVLHQGNLVDQTTLYQTLKAAEVSPNKKKMGKDLSQKNMGNLVEKLMKNEKA